METFFSLFSKIQSTRQRETIMKLLSIVCFTLCCNQIFSENFLNMIDQKMGFIDQKWKVLGNSLKTSMESIKSRQSGFREVTIVDNTIRHGLSQLYKIFSDDQGFMVNSVITNGQFNGKYPEFVIFVQDDFNSVWMN